MLAALFRRRPSFPVVSIPKQTHPVLFKQNPPWWARWALVLVSLDVMVATSAIELTWNYWSITPDTSAKGTETPNDHPVPSSESDGQRVLQPVWRRGAFCLLHFMSGCVVAGSILAARSRVVRSITIPKLSTTTIGGPMVGPRLYLETAGHPLNHGYEIYLERCKLSESKNKQQLSFEVKDHGRWLLDLRGASINGAAALPPSLNYDSMMKAWQLARQRPTVTPTDIPSTSKILKKKLT
ncbi:hypothetical protein BYT27DRAFT_7129537 [Phlegmacium glaucopus]|nr:hypothetical protein BYT27DRAFT_7129537 [Phlegmacium glaucopus]